MTTKAKKEEIDQKKLADHYKKLRETKYEISALTLAQISELLNHLNSLPFMDIAGMLGAEIRPQLPEEAQSELNKMEENFEETDSGMNETKTVKLKPITKKVNK